MEKENRMEKESAVPVQEVQPISPQVSAVVDKGESVNISKLEKQADEPAQKQVVLTPAIPKVQKDQVLSSVERIMEDGLREVYLGMGDDQRRKFKMSGEAAAAKIREIADKKKVRPYVVGNFIVRWMRQIVGLNPYYLLQAGYIKAERIIRKIKESREET